jgi:2-aminomuconate deaminase
MYASSLAMAEQDSPHVPDPVGAYPHARRAGDFLFLSGVGPRLPGSNDVPGNRFDEQGSLLAYDMERQCHSVFTNVRAILEHHGARWPDLVDITVFLTDIQRDFEVFNRIYTEYFGDTRPCRTTVEVTALPTPIAIELKCIAYLGGAQSHDDAD